MINLAKYAEMKICVAVSGGKDSMALLHYFQSHAKEYDITLSALNCDHKIRGAASARDSEFVKKWCSERAIPVLFFEWDYSGVKTESAARKWRLSCYEKAIEFGADVVATAHHLNDNAETVLFNLARGSALSGLTGITDSKRIIHPLISCTRSEIDEYISQNSLPFVEDESNFTDEYTRNKLRHRVLPELEKAVPNASEAIYRFSRLAAEDEQYFNNLIKNRGLIKNTSFGKEIILCEEKVIFRRAAVKVIKECFGRTDYTSAHAESLYNLQFAENGKKFEFLGLIAHKEEGRIAITEADATPSEEIVFENFNGKTFCGQPLEFCTDKPEITAENTKTLKFDFDKIPKTAVIRFIKQGDKFTKFGGGTKSLGDYFTDKKIPVRIRRQIPLIADGSEILAVCGVEISDKIKITEGTKEKYFLVGADYSTMT